MSYRKRGNQLPNNIQQLQNLIKRDPESYQDEFHQQYRHFQTQMAVFNHNPSCANPSKDLLELVMFVSHVSHCYPDKLSNFSTQLLEVLGNHAKVMSPESRLCFCKALMMLRMKDIVSPTAVLELFFKLLCCRDQILRKILYEHIVMDIKSVNSKRKNQKLNSSLQNFMYLMLKDSDVKAAKMSLDVMVELYRKQIWNDTKTVNVIVEACFSRVAKVQVAALQFFLGKDVEEDDSESENEGPTLKELMVSHKVTKKTRKKQRKLNKSLKNISKQKKQKACLFNFSAIHLIHDCQGFAERLFARLTQESANQRFEIKMLILNLISRLIGLHELILLNVYPYIQRYLKPSHKEVTKLLLFTAQASHALVPPDAIEPLLRTIANNFITERNSADVMAVGLNAVREVCARCPLAMSEELLSDLVEYKHHRDRPVLAAARSLLQLYRLRYPQLLKKRDRGRPTTASVEVLVPQFGKEDTKTGVPGAEVLVDEEEEELVSDTDDEESDEDDEWINVSHSDEDEEPREDEKEEDTESISVNRLFTQEDHSKIQRHQLEKGIKFSKTGSKRKMSDSGAHWGDELATLDSIENIYKKRKHDKSSRMESVLDGKTDKTQHKYRVKRANPLASTTNREKLKQKPFGMIKNKMKIKTKRSFREKQLSLRKSLMKRMKR